MTKCTRLVDPVGYRKIVSVIVTSEWCTGIPNGFDVGIRLQVDVGGLDVIRRPEAGRGIPGVREQRSTRHELKKVIFGGNFVIGICKDPVHGHFYSLQLLISK